MCHLQVNTDTHSKVLLLPLHAHDWEITPEIPRIAPTDRQSISQPGQRGIDAMVHVLVEGYHTLLYFWVGGGEYLIVGSCDAKEIKCQMLLMLQQFCHHCRARLTVESEILNKEISAEKRSPTTF